jgi:site-specific DNA-methyltransferase (adenine-specific)
MNLPINQIIQGDCLEVMRGLPDKSVDMVLCDLPYGTTACKWDVIIPFGPLWAQYKRIIKDNGAIVLTASQPFTSKLVMSNIKMFKYEWVWNKKMPSNIFLAKIMPLKIHENILVFSSGKTTYNPIPRLKNTKGLMSKKNLGKSAGTSENYNHANNIQTDNENEYGNPVSLIDTIPVFNNLGKDKKGLHPTQKPVALFGYLIKTYTNEGDLVLDNCIGSGTTAIACMRTGRNFIGIEKEQKYVDATNKRIEEQKQEMALFAGAL